MTTQIAFGKGNKVNLLCGHWKLNKKKEIFHFVRNGHWHYRPGIDTHMELEKIWEGVVPEEHDGHYNDAINWINAELERKSNA